MQVLQRLWAIYKAEPVRVVGYITSGVVFAASLFNVVVNPLVVGQYLGVAVVVIGLIEGTRSQTSPAPKLQTPGEPDGDDTVHA